MLEKIVKRLQKADINGWKIEEKFIEGQEYFFVKRELDLSRAKKVRHFDLTVYRDFYESERSTGAVPAPDCRPRCRMTNYRPR